MRTGERVLIAGAGPVGLVTALCLARRDVPVLVLEAEPGLTEDLRAGSFHPPTLELLEPLGITARLAAMGIVVPTWQFRDRKDGLVAEFDLGLLEADTPYPYRLHCEQHKLTPVVHELLTLLPHAEVRFGCRVVAVGQTAGAVQVDVESPAGRQTLEGAWLIGADGGRSTVRKAVGIEFEGFTWPEGFLVVSTPYDLAPHGFAYTAYVSDPDEWCAIFKVPGDGPPGLWRVAFPIPPEQSDDEATAPASVQARLLRLLPRDGPYPVVHRNTYRVHQRVAPRFRAGRVLLAGDAAHLNNPLGGMGLNSGIHDAVSLATALARVWRGEADAGELDRYERQRRSINIEYVQAMTIQNKRTLEERDPAVRRQRQDAMRRLAEDPARAREYLLQTSMIASVRRAATIR
jgi:3-(3-hydroxy-phenyl)propionate hydroxylase